MKKLILCVFLALITVLFSITVFSKGKDYVVDEAELITDAEEAILESRLSKLASKYSYDTVILTQKSLKGHSPKAIADDYYDYNGYGYGDNYDGMLFFICISSRDYYTSTYGRGIEVCGDYFIDYLDENTDAVSKLSDGKYYDSFVEYIDTVEMFLAKAESGSPYSYINQAPWKTSRLVIALSIAAVIALIIGLIYVSGLKKKMKTAVKKEFASDYVRDGSFVLKVARDMFLYSRTTKHAKPKSSSSSSSSSGRSHGGGGGKF